MSNALKTVARAIESIAGVKFERIGRKAYFVIDSAKQSEAWYSYKTTLAGILNSSQVTHVLDVGAHIGNFGRKIRSLFGGRISSFEPVASTFRELAASSASDKLWDAHQFALGSTTGTRTINVSPISVFSSLLHTNSYCEDRFGSEAVSTSTETIVVRRLDEVLEELDGAQMPQRRFLKLDTQGYDLEVFKGLGNKVHSIVALQSEISLIPIYDGMPHWTESIATYERAGFAIAGMYPVTRDGPRVIEYDCVLVRTSR